MAASTGINRETGAVLTDLDHTIQSFRVIITTHLAERVMRRTFGSAIPDLLGRNLAPETLALFFHAMWIAIELWEPRLRIVQMLCPAPPNTPVLMRMGRLTIAILADYRPHALRGDVVTDIRRLYL